MTGAAGLQYDIAAQQHDRRAFMVRNADEWSFQDAQQGRGFFKMKFIARCVLRPAAIDQYARRVAFP